MSHSDDEVRELGQQYGDVMPLDERREGTRYRTRLSDGTPIVVTVLSRELVAQLQEPGEFVTRLLEVGALAPADVPRLRVADRTSGGRVYFAYDLTDTRAFHAGAVPAIDVARAGAAIARALHAAHQAGLVHGCISTQRLVDSDRGAELDGLGLVDALHAAGMNRSDAALALTDAAYVAPEVQGGGDPGIRSDIYGLGASLYEILTGKTPFGGRTTSFVMATVLSDEEAGAETEKASGPVVESILRAIEAQPADRWADANAFAQALDAGAGGSSGSAPSVVAGGCLSRAAVLVFAAIGLATAAMFRS